MHQKPAAATRPGEARLIRKHVSGDRKTRRRSKVAARDAVKNSDVIR